jgi:hypothetical protein
MLGWLDRLFTRRKRTPALTGYTLAHPSRFDALTMTSWRDRAFWNPHYARQARQLDATRQRATRVLWDSD